MEETSATTDSINEQIDRMKNEAMAISELSRSGAENSREVMQRANHMQETIEVKGLVCLAISHEIAQQLDLPQMVDQNTEGMKTAFTIRRRVTPRSTATASPPRP